MENLSSVKSNPTKTTRTILFQCTRARPGAFWRPREAASAKIECDPSLLPVGSLARFLAENVQTTCYLGGNIVLVYRWMNNEKIPAPYRTQDGGRWDTFKWTFNLISDSATPEAYFNSVASDMINRGIERVVFRSHVAGKSVQWDKGD